MIKLACTNQVVFLYILCVFSKLCSWMEIEELNHITISQMIDFHMCIISFRCYESVPLNFALICPFKAGATRRSRFALVECKNCCFYRYRFITFCVALYAPLIFYLRLLSFISLALYSYLKRDRSLFAHAYYNHVIISLYLIGSCNIY